MTYEEFIEMIYNSHVDDWIYDDDEGIFVLKRDIRISILSDRSSSTFDEQDDFNEEWAQNFPDRNAKRKIYKLRFNGEFIEVFYAVSVDGHRSYIPYPKLDGMTITSFQYKIGQIINSIHGYSFDEYIQRARITVISD